MVCTLKKSKEQMAIEGSCIRTEVEKKGNGQWAGVKQKITKIQGQLTGECSEGLDAFRFFF